MRSGPHGHICIDRVTEGEHFISEDDIQIGFGQKGSRNIAADDAFDLGFPALLQSHDDGHAESAAVTETLQAGVPEGPPGALCHARTRRASDAGNRARAPDSSDKR